MSENDCLNGHEYQIIYNVEKINNTIRKFTAKDL